MGNEMRLVIGGVWSRERRLWRASKTKLARWGTNIYISLYIINLGTHFSISQHIKMVDCDLLTAFHHRIHEAIT